MARAIRILRLAAAFALALLLALAPGCSSEEGCQFEFEKDATTRDGTPWICAAGSSELTITFYTDGTGMLDGEVPFTWTKEYCRVVALDFAGDTVSVELFELGGNVEVGRLTFVLDDQTYLCGYGVPPP